MSDPAELMERVQCMRDILQAKRRNLGIVMQIGERGESSMMLNLENGLYVITPMPPADGMMGVAFGIDGLENAVTAEFGKGSAPSPH